MLNSFVTNKASLYPLAAMVGDGIQHLENFWTAEFCLQDVRIRILCQFLLRTEEQCIATDSWAAVGSSAGKKLLMPPLSWAWHSSSLLGYTGCHCNAKVWQANPASPVSCCSLLLQHFRSYHGMSYFIWKIYFARFLLQFACALLAPHGISRVTGTCSKGRIYIVWFSVQIWVCSCWAKTLILDSSGSNAWAHSILIFFFWRFTKCIKVAYKQSINNSVANKLLALYAVW